MKKYILNLVVIINSLIASAQTDFVSDSLKSKEIPISLQDKRTKKIKIRKFISI